MRIRWGGLLRVLITSLLALGLAAVAAVPARAQNATCRSSVKWTYTRPAPNTGWEAMPRSFTMTYGGYSALIGDLTGACTGNTSEVVGIVVASRPTIQVSHDRGATWHTVFSGPQIWWEGRGLIKRSGWFRIYYPGGTSSENDHWSAATSRTVVVSVRRKASTSLERKLDGVRATVHVAPARSIAGLRATFQVRRGGVWRTVKKAEVSTRGTARAYFPRSDLGARFRVLLPSARGFVRSVVGPRVLRRP